MKYVSWKQSLGESQKALHGRTEQPCWPEGEPGPGWGSSPTPWRLEGRGQDGPRHKPRARGAEDPWSIYSPSGAVPQLANSQPGTQLSTASICRRRPACVRVSHPYSWAWRSRAGASPLSRGSLSLPVGDCES